MATQFSRMKFSFAVALCLSLFTATSFAQENFKPLDQNSWNPGVHMAESMVLTLAHGKKVEEETDYGFCETCYLGAFLQPGNYSYMTMTLEQGQSYAFFGSTAGENTDLDIIVLDEYGNTVAEDTLTDNVPAVEFTPTVTARYEIRLKLYSGDEGEFCGMTLMRKGGWSVPIDNLATATSRTLEYCERVAAQVPARFLQEPQEWAMIGTIMTEGAESGYSDMRLGNGRRAIVACGDKHTRDIDLTVSQDSPYVEIDSDTETDANPLLDFEASGFMRYSLNIKNYESSGATLVMSAILDID
ncbi:MAG: hypothetical protein AAF456_03310 [Planctomycetota bacterium]